MYAGLQAEAESFTDPVTDGHNRKSFMRGLGDSIQKIQADSTKQYSVVFVDMDGFKAVNDACGHEEGDAALLEADLRLYDAVQDSDMVARLGGDEYVLLLEHKGGRDLTPETIRFKIQRIFDGMVRWDSEFNPHPIGASIGVVQLDRQAMGDMNVSEYAAHSLAQADQEMYKDKGGKEARLALQALSIQQSLKFELVA